MKKRVIIAGAAGRDYHNFLQYFKDNPEYKVIAFTQTQIPGIEKRSFPKELAGKLYNQDIPFYLETKLQELIKSLKVDYVFLSYSDLSHQYVMEFASRVLAAGANFALLGTKDTQIKSKKPIISITAVRTGAGKSQTSRAVAKILKKHNKKVVAIRHAMPYGDLMEQRTQRFSSTKDFVKNKCTIEEMEEYKPWISCGFVVYAGVDYQAILNQAEKEADIILFDGGNNDWSFYKSDINIVVVDAHRPNHEVTYYPGFVNFLTADIIIINKVNTALKSHIKTIEKNIQRYNPMATVIKAKSLIKVGGGSRLKGKKVLIVGDGPSLTHGGLIHSAGYFLIKRYGAQMIDARKYAQGSIKEVYKKYSHLERELPAMGYSFKQLKDLQNTINKSNCDIVLDSSPANLKDILKVNKPILTVSYELDNKSIQKLELLLKRFI